MSAGGATFPPLSTSWPSLRSSPSRRPRPLHDPPATFACPAGPRRCWSVGIDWAGRFAPGARIGGWFVPLQWRHTVSPGGGEPPWHHSIVLVRGQGPSGLRRLDVTSLGSNPVLHDLRWARRTRCRRLLRRHSLEKTAGCGGSGGRGVSIGVGGSLLCRRACSGRSAPPSGLLGGLEAVLVACDSLPLHPSAWIRALSLGVPVIARCLRRRRGGMCMCMVGGCGWGRGDDGGSDGGDARPYRSCRQPR